MRHVPTSILARATAAVSGMMREAIEGWRSGWFAPLAPMAKVPPDYVEPRVWEFQPGFNVAGGPRGTEATSFAELRALANAEKLTRMAIETRKDQVAKVPFNARPIPIPGETPREAQKRGDDPRIHEINAFLRYPGRVMYYPSDAAGNITGPPQLRRVPWDQWMRALVEDMLVIDAPAIMVRRNAGGGAFSLDVMDGALFKPVLDANGNVTAYQQWLYGVPSEVLGPDELVLYPRNHRSSRVYGFSPVEQILLTINLALRRDVQGLAYYTDGNIPAALCKVPKEWSPAQIEQFQKYWNAYQGSSAAAKAKMTFVPDGTGDVKFTNIEGLMSVEQNEWLARVVSYCFSLSPLWAVKMMNRATSASQQKMALEEGLVPLLEFLSGLVTLAVQTAFGVDDIEVGNDYQTDIEPDVQATIDREYVTAGIWTVDEVRERQGKEPFGLPPGVITAQGFVPFPIGKNAPPKGGELRLLPAANEGDEEAAAKLAKRRHYAASDLHVMQDRVSRLEKAARVSA